MSGGERWIEVFHPNDLVRRKPLLQMLAFGTVLCAVLYVLELLVVPWFPRDASTQAHQIHTLYYVLLIASTPIFALVVSVVLYCAWKFRMRPGQELMDGPPIHGNTRLEVVWTAVPSALIVGLCAYTFVVLHNTEVKKRREITVNVTARQFAFEFSYRNARDQLVVSPTLYLADHQPVVFHIRSLDVIHSFFVPEFSEKIDAVPGIVTSLRVTPDRIGDYAAECTELCGPGHSFMRAPVRVVSRAQFARWLNTAPTNTPPPLGVPPSDGAASGVPGYTHPFTGPRSHLPGSLSHPQGSGAAAPSARKSALTGLRKASERQD
jgi:cytochrome c oxidase subunit 2